MSKRKKSINVIAYLSVANATDKNVDWKEEKQLSYISEYAKAHNLRIIKIMHKNIMGCSVVNTHFNKMVREIQNEKADGILVCNIGSNFTKYRRCLSENRKSYSGRRADNNS